MRKVLSFVLVLTLVLSSFSMAFASEASESLSDIAGNANEEAITVDFNLGIIDGMGDGTFAPDQAVTRAQFAAMITRALAIPDSALAGYTTTTFKDTSGYGWAVPYLAFCQSKGILVGDGYGNVMPGRTVSVNEAMTMVMRAVGYTNNSAALVGVWPANYVSLAQNNDLYDDVATTVTVNRANAAQIIYNALTVDKVEVASDGKTTVLSDRTNSNEDKWKIVNMLTTGLNCYSKVVTISGDEETQINLRTYVGQKVTAFFNKDDEIVAIYSVESDAITGDFEKAAVVKTSGTSIVLASDSWTFEGDDDVNYTIKDREVYEDFILNGESYSKLPYDLDADTTVTINGDISGKNIKRIDTLSTWIDSNAKKVKAADVTSIKDDQALLGSDFTTLKDGSIDKNSFQLEGVKSLDDIKADNIVAVYEKGADGDIVKVAVGTKVVEGVVKSTKSSGKKLVVDGATYERSSLQGSKEISDKKVEAGDTVKLYLDADGDVYTYDVTGGGNNDYAALMNSDNKYDKVKLYTEDDDSAWYELAGDVKIKDFDNVTTFVGTTSDDAIGLISYGLNSKGKVDSASTALAFNADTATVSGLTLKFVDENGKSGSYKIDPDCAVYGVTADGTDVDGYVKIGDVETGKDLGKIVFMVDDEDKDNQKSVVAMLVNAKDTSKSSSDAYAVVHEIQSTKNDDGNKAQEVFGLIDGASLDKTTNDTGIAQEGAVKADQMGTVWKVKFDSAGYIDEMTLVKAGMAKAAQGIATIGYNEAPQGVSVTAIDDNNLKVDFDKASLGIDADDWHSIAPDAVVYKATLDGDSLDVYKVSNVSAIHEGYYVWLYNTIDDDDSAASDGYDVVVYLTGSDYAKWDKK